MWDEIDKVNIKEARKMINLLVSSGYQINEVITRRIFKISSCGELQYKLKKRSAIIGVEMAIKGVYNTLTVYPNGKSKLSFLFDNPF